MVDAKGRPVVVHVVGTGTIGEPLIGLLCSFKDQLGFEEITFHKRTPVLTDRSKLLDLCRRGARLATDPDRAAEFRDLGLAPEFTRDEALARATVVIDCTPAGNENKEEYLRYRDSTAGFVAQGSESGFGKPYARGINDGALIPEEDRFLQVVSCNTHNIALMLHSIGYLNGQAYNNLQQAQFVCMRRANDLSQVSNYLPAPQVGIHSDDQFGTHHARDAHRLFQTLGLAPNCTSSAIKLNTQYMHAVWFNLHGRQRTSRAEVLELFSANPQCALTYKRSMNEVFSFGRDHGHYGRILNQSVVAHETLFVHGGGRQVSGFCFTPQDGNSLLSSVAAACWLVDPDGYRERLAPLEAACCFREV
ncbi:MAG: hypothetical protein ACYTFT_00020 [Planctomycetota bacterium]|jgi:glyceraldehyde-3-phosphate dehydrogenase (NAD(P))